MMDFEQQPYLVSVIIPTYKRSDTLIRAIDSVLAQTYQNIEVLIVNDNEKNDRFSIELYDTMKKYSLDKRVLLVEQEKHINGAAARNAGIEKARGQFIAFLDDDDWWETHKIELQVEYLLNADKTIGMVSCLSKRYKNGEVVFVSIPFKEGNLFKPIMYRNIGLGTGSVLIRREVIDDCGMFDIHLKRHQDLQFFVQIAAKYRVGLIKKYLYNIDASDVQNKPTSDNILIVKNDYYRSIKTYIETMTSISKRHFYLLNDIEISYVYFREKKYKQSIILFFRLMTSPYSIFSTLKRILNRKKGTWLKRFYLKKYN